MVGTLMLIIFILIVVARRLARKKNKNMISFAKNIRLKFENESLFNKKYFISSKFGFMSFFFIILYPFYKQEVYIMPLNKYLYFVVY